MDPATAATAITVAGLLKDYGPWGIVALLVAAVVYLDRGRTASQEARVTDAKLATDALARQAGTNAEMAAGLRDLREGQTEVMRIVSLLQRDTENGDDRTKEKIEALTGAVLELGRRLEQACRGGPR